MANRRKTKAQIAAGTKAGQIAKRAAKIYEGRKTEYAKQFKAARGNAKKIKAAAAEYRKKYGSTPAKRWGRAMKDAKAACK